LTSSKNYQEHSENNCPDIKQFRLDTVYLKMAQVWATNSHCKRSQVGCLVVKDKTIVSDGYNGTPTGFPNICEDENNQTLSSVLHAEANAITKLAMNTVTSSGSTMYVTLSPCYMCAKAIINAGVSEVRYTNEYRDRSGIELLEKHGIKITRL
jgi:dCMP deaminase